MSDAEIEKLRADTALLRAQTDHKLAVQMARFVDERDRLANRNEYVVAILWSLVGAGFVVAGMLFGKYVLFA